MKDKIFFDTNILVYAFDNSNAKKYQTSSNLIQLAFEDKNGYVSTQVLQEFFVVTTKKLKINLTVDEARDIIKDFSVWPVIEVKLSLIFNAIEFMKRHTLCFWDSLILCSAKTAACNIIYTEDLSHGQTIDDIKIINPFISLEIFREKS